MTELVRPDDLVDICALGFSLAEAKQLRARFQQAVVATQARAIRPGDRNVGLVAERAK